MTFNTTTLYRFALAVSIFGMLSCGQQTDDSANKIRIAVAGFSHETCTFCPEPTTVESYERGGVYRGDEVIEAYRGVQIYINGFIKVAEEEGDVELVGIVDASNAWGGSSGSWITAEAFDKYTGEIAQGLKEKGPFDGVLLALHGAMAAENYPKAEAEIVRRARKVVGDIPIMVTLDLHANEDHELTDAADAVFVITEYPHRDKEKTGVIAARAMVETIRGNFEPVMAIRKPGVITPSLFQGTDFYPARDIRARARKWEQEEGVYSLSVAFGFAYADVPDVGATVIAVTNGDQELAERAAQDVSDYIWELREPFANKKVPKTKEAVAQAIEAARAGRTPVVIADHADRTGDSTHVLRELIDQGASNFCVATIADEKAVQEIAANASVGDEITVDLGGWATDLAGTPVGLTGVVEHLGEVSYVATGPLEHGVTRRLGTVAVLGFGDNNHVVVTPTLHQVKDDAIFPAIGLSLEELDIVAIKSRVHFRAYYQGVAGTIVEVDAPGLGPADLSGLDYKNIPRDIYPLSETTEED
jgi:microcystin degradation protein MlrC